MWFKRKNKHNGLPFKQYVARLNQSGTGAPVPTVAFDNSGMAPVFSRVSAGIYRATKAGAFTDNKTELTVTDGYVPDLYRIRLSIIDTNIIEIRTYEDEVLADDILGSIKPHLKIVVYE